MDEPSFDPRSWSRPQAGEKPKDDGQAAAGNRPAGGGTQLPAAWQSVVAAVEDTAAAAIPDAPPPAGPRRRAWAMPLALLGSAALLAGAGTWAWLSREAARPADPAATAPETGTPAPPPEASAPPPPMAVERALNLAGIGDLAEALVQVGLPPAEAAAAAGAAAAAMKPTGVIRARIVLLPAGESMALQTLQASNPDGSGAVVRPDATGGFTASAVAADLSREVKVLRGELDTESFYSSAVAAGLIDTLIPEFINAFGYDFNLAAEILPGDTFEVAYEQAVNESGEPFGQPQLLFAQLTTRTKSLALYRFRDAEGAVGWYDGNGASTRRGLMRTPVDGARISSKFGMRFHPVLHYNRLHGGTDFAAPTGTPIYAAADGAVEFAAMKGANGNLTVIRHDNGWRTLYLHQNRFMPGIAPGVRVIQGQHIGDVGTTGRSTGPHLHYEVHIDGQRVDPLSIRTDDARRKRMEGTLLAAFMRERDRVDVARARQGF